MEGHKARSTAFTGSEGVYMLPHHQKEAERLQKQHYFMNSTTKDTLLAEPITSSSQTLKVLDAGAADGTWLLDLSRKLPTHTLSLYGVDIGSSLFPPPSSTSPALDLRTHNLTQPYPQSWNWSNSFDAIHQRLLVWGLKKSEWPAVIKNHMAILKPGGYLQMVEAEWIDAEKPASLPQLKKQAELQRWSTGTFGMDVDVAYRLEDMMREAGFEGVEKVTFQHGYGGKAREEGWKDGSAELWVECFRSLDAKMPAGGIPGVAKDKAEFHEFLDELEKEIKKYGYQPKLNFVYGRKPF